MALVTSSTGIPTHDAPIAPAPRSGADIDQHNVAIDVERMSFFYGEKQALFDLTTRLREKLVTAFIGPSGCGKSTFLRTLNRMNDIIPNTRVTRKILVEGKDIYDPKIDPVSLRREVGMVFQKSMPWTRYAVRPIRHLADAMMGNPAVVTSALEVMLMTRHLERIGDHATNIAEEVFFVSE